MYLFCRNMYEDICVEKKEILRKVALKTNLKTKVFYIYKYLSNQPSFLELRSGIFRGGGAFADPTLGPPIFGFTCKRDLLVAIAQ